MQLKTNRQEIMNALNYQCFIRSLSCANIIKRVLHYVCANHRFITYIITYLRALTSKSKLIEIIIIFFFCLYLIIYRFMCNLLLDRIISQ